MSDKEHKPKRQRGSMIIVKEAEWVRRTAKPTGTPPLPSPGLRKK
jgi:hypothetical protein